MKMLCSIAVLFVLVVASLAAGQEPAVRSGRVGDRPRSGAARVVRVDATREALAAARSRLRSRGLATDFIAWSGPADTTVGAAPDDALDALRTEGIRAEVLFDTIVAYDAAVAKAESTAREIAPPAEPRYEVRVVVVDLRASRGPNLAVDPEAVLRRDDRRMAILDASDAADPGTDLRSRYERRGLAVAEVTTLDDFERRSTRLFPSHPFTSQDVKVWKGGPEAEYTSYDELADGLRALEAAHPDLVRVSSIGETYEGRELWAAKISAHVSVDDPAKPDVLFTGCYHAREWISVEVPYALARRLPDLYASDPRVRYLLDTVEVWVVPAVNADGLAYSQTRPNHTNDNVRYWRKNRRPIDVDGDGVAEGLGVDLNRNHSVKWRLEGDLPFPSTGDDVGASDDPGDFQLYRGPSPASEPEIRALEAFTADSSHPIVARVDYHNFGQLVLYPLGYTHETAVDDLLFRALARDVQRAIAANDGAVYRPQQAVDLYPVTGDSTDSAYERDRTVALTVELSPPGCCFDLDASLRETVIADNLPGALAMARWATGPIYATEVTLAADGRTVYRARWEPGPAGRVLAVERTGALSGDLRLSVRFSQPLADEPHVAVATGGALTDVVLARTPSRYDGDTWEADVTLSGGAAAARLLVDLEATTVGAAGFDAMPATIASYAVGSGGWSGREDGPDLSFLLVPGEDEPAPELEITSPTGGFGDDGRPVFAVATGEAVDVEWSVRGESQVVEQRVEFSGDYGNTYTAIADHLSPAARSVTWTVPAGYGHGPVIFRVRASDVASNVTLSSPTGPVGVSDLAISRIDYKAKKKKLTVRTTPTGLDATQTIELEVDGRPVFSFRGIALNRNGDLVVKATREQLGLTPGRPSRIRLVLGGWPTPAFTFTP